MFVDVKKRLSSGNREGIIVVQMTQGHVSETQEEKKLVTSVCNAGDVSSCICHTSGPPKAQEAKRGKTGQRRRVSTRRGNVRRW